MVGAIVLHSKYATDLLVVIAIWKRIKRKWKYLYCHYGISDYFRIIVWKSHYNENVKKVLEKNYGNYDIKKETHVPLLDTVTIRTTCLF